MLCPLTRGLVGTRNLNQVLQNLLNPARSDKAEVVRGGITLRVGDRLIQRVNDYERIIPLLLTDQSDRQRVVRSSFETVPERLTTASISISRNELADI